MLQVPHYKRRILYCTECAARNILPSVKLFSVVYHEDTDAVPNLKDLSMPSILPVLHNLSLLDIHIHVDIFEMFRF